VATTRKPANQTSKAKAALAAVNESAEMVPEVRSKKDMRMRAMRNKDATDWVWVPELESAVWFRKMTAGDQETALDYAIDPETGESSQLRQTLKQLELVCIDPVFTEDDFGWLAELEIVSLHILTAGIAIHAGLREGEVAMLQKRFPESGRPVGATPVSETGGDESVGDSPVGG
jgi:hypothetical protein